MPPSSAPSASPFLRRRTLVTGAAALLAASGLRAQPAYPSKPVRLVLPHAAGSAVDATARKLAVPLADGLGQPVVIENVAGSGGVIGINQVVRSPKDGYTLGMTANNLFIGPYLYKLPFDPLKDLMPVSVMTTSAMVLLVNPKLPARSFAEFLALAKSRPGKEAVNYGSAGVGTVGHLAGALMEMSSGADFLHVPYKGQNTFTTDLLGGQIESGFFSTSLAVPLVRNGSLRALAVSTPRRGSSLPEVPTLAESGLAGYDINGSQVAFVAAGTPAAVVQRINTEIARALRSPDVAKFIEDNGSQAVASSVEEAQRSFARDFEVYGKLAHRIGLKPEN